MPGERRASGRPNDGGDDGNDGEATKRHHFTEFIDLEAVKSETRNREAAETYYTSATSAEGLGKGGKGAATGKILKKATGHRAGQRTGQKYAADADGDDA